MLITKGVKGGTHLWINWRQENLSQKMKETKFNARAALFSPADRAYMKAPVLRRVIPFRTIIRYSIGFQGAVHL